MTLFSEKLTNWLQQQPEYPVLFLADRPARRRAARSLAKAVLTIPTAEHEGPNRRERRKLYVAQTRAIGQLKTELSKRQQRMMREAEKQRRRYARLSEERLVELEMDRLAQSDPEPQ